MKKRTAALFLCLALTAALAGCGETRDSAQTVTENAIKAVQKMDLDSMRSYWGKDGFGTGDLTASDEVSKELAASLTSKLTYTVKSAVENENDATVTVEFTNLDMAQIFSEFMGNMISEAFSYAFLPEEEQPSEEELQAKYMDELKELLDREDNPTVTNTVDIPLTLVDGNWKITPSDEIIDAMLGGLNALADSMGGAINE